MPHSRKKPCSTVTKCLSGTEFTSGLFSPWLCELRQDSLFSFCDLVNRLIKRLEVSPEKVTNGAASVICIDNMWNWDPISAVSAYFCSASVIDQVLTRLPCSDDGHTCVDWRLLSKSKDFPSLQMVLATTTSDVGRQLLEDLFLCHKQAEEIKLIQMALIEVALNLNVLDVDKLMKSSEPLKIIPRAVFNTLCQRKRYDYLPVIELAVAVAQALETPTSAPPTSITTVEGLLRRYENALMLSHCEDAASDASLLTDDDALKNCRPILLNAIRDASQLPTADDVLLVLIRLIWLLPSRGCNPNSKANATLIKAIDYIFTTIVANEALGNSAIGRFLNVYKQKSLGHCLLAATYRRHLLPAYRESVRNTGFPQMIPPVVQMCRDLARAHHEPSTASSALQSLRHRPINSSVIATGKGDSDANSSDPSLFSNVSKLISMGRIGVGRRAPQPYSPNLVILVVYGTMTWGLAREIVDTVTQNTLEPLEVLIVCNYLLRGRDIFQQCLL